MLFDRVLGNILSDPAGRYSGRAQDAWDMTWRECARRAVRGRTVRGLSVGALLPPGKRLRHGDVLADDDRAGLVVVNVLPCETWVATFADAASLAAAALELGNLHVPVEIDAGADAASVARLVALPDGPVRGVFDRLARSCQPAVRRFQPLPATVTAGAAATLSPDFRLVRRGADRATPRASQLMNSRE